MPSMVLPARPTAEAGASSLAHCPAAGRLPMRTRGVQLMRSSPQYAWIQVCVARSRQPSRISRGGSQGLIITYVVIASLGRGATVAVAERNRCSWMPGAGASVCEVLPVTFWEESHVHAAPGTAPAGRVSSNHTVSLARVGGGAVGMAQEIFPARSNQARPSYW